MDKMYWYNRDKGRKKKERNTKDVKKQKWAKLLQEQRERERERVTFRVKISFIFDAKKSEESRSDNIIDNSKKLIKEAMKKWINKKDGLLYGKLESTEFSKLYDSLSFL